MRVLATYGIKGGVGKTSAAVNLAAIAAASGRRTLLWDLDPQGAAGYLLRVKPKVKGGTLGLLAGHRELDDAIKSTEIDGLELLPADVTARNADLTLEDAKRPIRQVNRLLKPLADDYDVVILDCPPSLSLLSENVFEAAHLLLAPVVPSPLSMRTLTQLRSFLDDWEGHRPAVGASSRWWTAASACTSTPSRHPRKECFVRRFRRSASSSGWARRGDPSCCPARRPGRLGLPIPLGRVVPLL